MPANREKGVVEIQFRDLQRDQEGDHLGLAKQKEEKKEIFTKVIMKCLWRWGCLCCGADMEAQFSTTDSIS